MELKVWRSGESLGNYTPKACVSCQETVPDGELLVLYDDRAYLPTFCISCVANLFAELLAERILGPPTSEG